MHNDGWFCGGVGDCDDDFSPVNSAWLSSVDTCWPWFIHSLFNLPDAYRKGFRSCIFVHTDGSQMAENVWCIARWFNKRHASATLCVPGTLTICKDKKSSSSYSSACDVNCIFIWQLIKKRKRGGFAREEGHHGKMNMNENWTEERLVLMHSCCAVGVSPSVRWMSELFDDNGSWSSRKHIHESHPQKCGCGRAFSTVKVELWKMRPLPALLHCPTSWILLLLD